LQSIGLVTNFYYFSEKFKLMETNTLIPILCISVIGLGIWALLMRWVFRIDTIVSNQEKQLRSLEETVIQNEKIIKLLSKVGTE
jgi:hypothetical protein